MGSSSLSLSLSQLNSIPNEPTDVGEQIGRNELLIYHLNRTISLVIKYRFFKSESISYRIRIELISQIFGIFLKEVKIQNPPVFSLLFLIENDRIFCSI